VQQKKGGHLVVCRVTFNIYIILSKLHWNYIFLLCIWFCIQFVWVSLSGYLIFYHLKSTMI